MALCDIGIDVSPLGRVYSFLPDEVWRVLCRVPRNIDRKAVATQVDDLNQLIEAYAAARAEEERLVARMVQAAEALLVAC